MIAISPYRKETFAWLSVIHPLKNHELLSSPASHDQAKGIAFNSRA
jgi:hypothetical protein